VTTTSKDAARPDAGSVGGRRRCGQKGDRLDRLAVFGLSILMSFVAFAVLATVFVVPRLRGAP